MVAQAVTLTPSSISEGGPPSFLSMFVCRVFVSVLGGCGPWWPKLLPSDHSPISDVVRKGCKVSAPLPSIMLESFEEGNFPGKVTQ